MRITRWGEFGVLCALYIAKTQNGMPVGASDISRSQSLPLKYAQQILHRLRKGGIIKSTRGPHGGFALARSPEEITLKDILVATEGQTFELICDTKPLGTEQCNPQGTCGLSYVWTELQDAIDSVLKRKTLQSLVAFQPAEVLVVINGKVPAAASQAL